MANKIKPNLIAFLAGILIVFAFAPFNYFILAPIAPAILLSLWLKSTPRQAFTRGFSFGLGMFGLGVSWVFVSIHEYGNTNVFLASIITLLFIMTLGLFTGIHGVLLNYFFPHNTKSKLLLGFPASFALMEWLRSWIFTGFPWLLLGDSQVSSPMRGLIPLVGIYGTTFIITLTSGLIVLSFKRNIKHIVYSIISITLILASGFALGFINWTQPGQKAIQVSLVQGNIPQELKWSPEYLQRTLDRYYLLTQAHWNSQLIIWPEAAIPIPQRYVENFLTLLDNEAKNHHATLITGVPKAANELSRYYNAMIVLGEGHGEYFKRHLVPFGEYVPLEKLLRGLIGFFDIPMSSFISGEMHQADLVTDSAIIAPFICYETAYSDILLSALPRANLLVTITNDAWFGNSLAPHQHIQIAQSRALQSGRYHLFASNNGITAIIKPNGAIQQTIPQFSQGVLTGTVFTMSGNTPWSLIGTYPFIILFIGLLLLAALLNKKST